MNHILIVTQSIEINAEELLVWDALINPEKIKIYLFGAETISGWKKGDSITFQGEYSGHAYKDKGIVIDIHTAHLLQYSYWSGFSGLEDRPENYSLVTYALKKMNDKTHLTLTQKGFANEESRLHSNTAWTGVLQKIKEIAESGI